jgi:drug/metabolite transporter (DMT)-like permease
VADATIISALQPALILLVVGRLFGERVRRRDVAWTLVAIGGVAIVVFASGEVAGRSLAGDLLAVVALGAWAWYFVAAKQGRRRFAALEYQTSLAVVAAVIAAPVIALWTRRLAVPDVHTAVLLGVTVLMGTAGHFLMNWAHASTPLTLTSLLTLLSPGVSVAAAALLLGEPVLAAQVLGIIVVVVSLGIVVAHTTTANRQAGPLDGAEVEELDELR